MAGGRYDPGVTEPALPTLAVDGLEAIVVDTDGVLTDTASVHAAAWKRLFDVAVDGVEAGRLGLAGKPDPGLFLEAARRLGVVPARVVVVEDALAGVEAGRRGGFGLVIGVNRGGQAAALAERGAGVVVDDLGELAVAGAGRGRGGR